MWERIKCFRFWSEIVGYLCLMCISNCEFTRDDILRYTIEYVCCFTCQSIHPTKNGDVYNKTLTQQYFSYIVAVSCIGEGNRSTWRKPPIFRKSLTNLITYCCIEYTSQWTGFDLTTLVVIGTDCTGSCKSNYHTITTTMIPV